MEKSDVLVMTKNEYQDYLSKIARRLHTDAGYSLQDFQRDADRVQVLGFELDQFNLSDVDRQIINKMFDSDEKNKNGNLLLRGHVMDRGFVNMIANTLYCHSACDNGLNGFYTNRDKRCLLEFCEGDIYLTLCETNEAYNEEWESLCTFYEVKLKDTSLKVFFDDVHIDSVYVPRDEAEEIKASILKYGYAGYNVDAKEDYEKLPGSRPNPVVTVKIDDGRSHEPLASLIGNANARVAKNSVSDTKEHVSEQAKDLVR